MERKRDSFFLSNKKQKAEEPDKKAPDNKRQEEFDKNRDIKKNNAEKKENSDKKPFDKKTYRLKKYSKKYKLEQWEEHRKKKLIREFQKDVKNDPVLGSYKPKAFDEDTTDSQDVGKYVRHPDIIEKENVNIKKKEPFKKAKEQFNKMKEDKIKKREELEKVIAERNKKLQEYKKTKHERFKKLSKKTKKGQPMMTGRMELLLEKIQKGSK